MTDVIICPAGLEEDRDRLKGELSKALAELAELRAFEVRGAADAPAPVRRGGCLPTRRRLAAPRARPLLAAAAAAGKKRRR